MSTHGAIAHRREFQSPDPAGAETEVFQQDDPEVLDWAVVHNRIVITHDVNTMTK
jgi:hypothetical protein